MSKQVPCYCVGRDLSESELDMVSGVTCSTHSRSESEWVDLRGHPPRDGQKCFIYCYDPTFDSWDIKIDKYVERKWALDYNKDGWLHTDNRYIRVTHWMPFTIEPPKGMR